MGNESISIADSAVLVDSVSVMLSGDGPPWPDDSPRNHPHTGKYYLAVQPRTVVFSGRITGWTDAMNIQYTDGTWWGTATAGMTLAMEQDDGTQAVVRVKTIPDGDFSGTVIVAENDHMDWDYNKTFYVLGQFELWPVHPRVTYNGGLTFYKDYDIAYSDQNENFYPVPIMGPPAVAFLSGGTASVEFSGEHCYTPDGSANSSWAWTFEDGDPATYASVATSVSWTTAGIYLVTITITNAHGKSSTGYRYIYIFDRTGSDAPYTSFTVTRLTGSLSGGGWSCNISVWQDDIDLNDFPPGAQVVLFAEELWEDNSVVGKGMFIDRDNIKMVGWIEQNSVSFNHVTGQVDFSIVGIHRLMQNCEIFSCALDYDNTPSVWTELKGLNAIRAFHHLIYWQSTLMTIVDVFLPGQLAGSQPAARLPAAWDIKFQDFGQASLWSQIKGLCDDVFCLIASDRCSTVFIGRDPQSVEATYIGDVSVWLTLAKTDWFGDAVIQIQDEPHCSQITLEGVYYIGGTDTIAPVFSYSPGTVPSHRGRIIVHSGSILSTDELSAAMAGRLYAIANNPLPRVTLALLGNYGPCVDIAPFRWVQITLLTTDTPRAISWSQRSFQPLQVEDSIAIGQGTLQTSITLAGYAHGGPGVTITPPEVPPAYSDDPGVTSSGHLNGIHYRHAGFTPHIIDSYFAPGWASLNEGSQVGIAWASTNVVSCNYERQKHYRLNGFSATVTDSHATPTAQPVGIAWDGTNLISSEYQYDKHFLHTGFSASISDSYVATSQCQGITWDGTNVIARTFVANIYVHAGFTDSVTDSFGAPGWAGGLGWNGIDLLSVDTILPKHFKHTGISASISDSYLWPRVSYAWGIDWSGTALQYNVLSLDSSSLKQYKHTGFSASIQESYTCPGTSPAGMGWDGTNVLSVDYGADKHYKHTGFSSSITSSYSTPSSAPWGIAWDGTSVLSSDSLANKIYRHTGFSGSISASFTSPDITARGVSWDGTNVLSVDDMTDKHYKHDGFSDSILVSYAEPGGFAAAGITWDGTNVMSANPFRDKHYKHVGFAATVDESYTAPSSSPRGIVWDGRNR